MKLTIILLGIALVVFGIIKYLKKRKEKKKSPKIKYISTHPNLSIVEYDFYDALNKYAPNDLILDRIASGRAYHFAVYCNNQNTKLKNHVGVGDRIATLKRLGATSVSEIYAGGYRTLETSIKRLKESPSHNRAMLSNYTHIGVAVVNKHYVAIYFNIK